jgi:AcrR family transcriptional regulator
MAFRQAPTAPAGRNPRGQGELLRERLLDAAVELVDQQGDATHLSVRAVTARAGVSPTALYLHFDNRDELMQALTERGFAQFRTALNGAAQEAEDPAQRLLLAGLAYMRFAQEQPAMYAIIFGPQDPPAPGAEPPPKPAVAGEAFEDLVSLIADYLGPERSAGIDLAERARGIWSGLHGFVTLRRARPQLEWSDDERFGEALAAAWLGPPGD